MISAELVADGKATPDDAKALLATWWKGRDDGAGKPRRNPPSKVQVSKFKTFLDVADVLGRDGVRMLYSVPRILARNNHFEGIYNAGISIARKARDARRVLSDAELDAALKDWIAKEGR
jgi:hypothetical protein